MKTGIERIAQERQEQIEKHKWNDSLHVHGELAEAAVALMTADCYMDEEKDLIAPEDWHYETWMHMVMKPYEDRLIMAGALIAAELDRLQAKNT